MDARKLAVGLASAALFVALVIAIQRVSERRSAAAELAVARQERNRLNAQAAEYEKKFKDAERTAAEAEKDRQDLAKGLASLRAEQVATASSPPPSIASTAPKLAENPPEPEVLTEEQARLTVERVYAQALAKQRKEEATRRADFERLLGSLDPIEKFNRRIEMAETYAAEAEFQLGIRVSNEAMAEKPADLAVPESVKALVAMLRSQSAPVNVTLMSDGETFVSIAGRRGPVKITTDVVQILPGNYRVIGQRPGYRQVVVSLEIRAGSPPPVVSVVCTQPLPE